MARPAPAGRTRSSRSACRRDLVDLVRASAEATGQTVSATIAASLRRTLEEAEQANLDRALELDSEWNLEWVKATWPMTAKLWEELEW